MYTVCPYCQVKFRADAEMVNTEAECPSCHNRFMIFESKFCESCGIANHHHAIKCHSCSFAFRVHLEKQSYDSAETVKNPAIQTVCPHCHRIYEVSNDYLQQEVTCASCNDSFFVNVAKFCMECGAANPKQAFKCWSCVAEFTYDFTEEKNHDDFVSDNFSSLDELIKSAEQSNDESQYQLAMFLLAQNNIEGNRAKALNWLYMASGQGHLGAKQCLREEFNIDPDAEDESEDKGGSCLENVCDVLGIISQIFG